MNVLLSLSLWLALLMPPCCGNGGSREDELITGDYEYSLETVTPDYDYTATFDYYYVTGIYGSEVHNKATWVGPLNPLLLLGLALHQIWN